MSDIQTVIPRPGEIRPDKPYRTPDRRWEEVTEEIYSSSELPTNIEIEHDPLWDQRFWSSQNAHNQSQLKSFGFWTFIGGLMIFSDVCWYFIRTIR